MRISDWSSDVCSSDLDPRRPPPPAPIRAPALAPEFDQIGVFLRNARPIPGLLWRDRIHAHLHLLDLAPHLPRRHVKYDFVAVRPIFQRDADAFIPPGAIGARYRGQLHTSIVFRLPARGPSAPDTALFAQFWTATP